MLLHKLSLNCTWNVCLVPSDELCLKCRAIQGMHECLYKRDSNIWKSNGWMEGNSIVHQWHLWRACTQKLAVWMKWSEESRRSSSVPHISPVPALRIKWVDFDNKTYLLWNLGVHSINDNAFMQCNVINVAEPPHCAVLPYNLWFEYPKSLI